jgi:hypothetical protein
MLQYAGFCSRPVTLAWLGTVKQKSWDECFKKYDVPAGPRKAR